MSDGALPQVDPPDDDDEQPEPLHWGRAALAFSLTVLSTFAVGAWQYVGGPFPSEQLVGAWRGGHPLAASLIVLRYIAQGWTYSVPLLTILLFHEFAHFLAAKWHGVPASLPMFIPLPLAPVGTLGAVIRMPTRIRRRDALLDIGASGPLAGLAIALPITWYGLRLSEVRPVLAHGQWLEEGTSLIFAALKFLAKGRIPAGHEVVLHPTAMAGWVALLITMLNLVPYGQLDGGHVSYALFRHKSARLARAMLVALPLLGVAVGLYFGRQAIHAHRDPWQLGTGFTQGLNWFVYAFMVWALHREEGGAHPPTDLGPLSPKRRFVAIATLLVAVALFMPVPLRSISVP